MYDDFDLDDETLDEMSEDYEEFAHSMDEWDNLNYDLEDEGYDED